MRWRRSLVGRLVVSLLVLVLAFGTVAAAVGTMTIRREMNEAMDNTLRQTARRLLPLIVVELFSGQNGPMKLAEAVADEDEPVVFQVRDATGRILLHSAEAPTTPLTARLQPGFSNEGGWRVYTEPTVSDSLFVQVAEAAGHRNEEVLEAAAGVLWPLAIMTPLAALAAWFAVRAFASPITTLRGDIQSRYGENLASIRTAGMAAELASIARSVNSLMRRLASAMQAEKEFSANAAHELRTPIAGALAQIERLAAESRDDATRHRAAQIRAALLKLSNLSEKLLQLARADAGIAGGGPSDLGQTLTLVTQDLRHQDGKERIAVDFPSSGPFIRFDQDALGIVARNLIENAMRHGASGSQVIVRAELTGRLAVSNQAPLVPPDRLNALQSRFARGETSAEGSGLGLAIVARLVQSGGARLTLTSQETLAGPTFEASVDFPLA